MNVLVDYHHGNLFHSLHLLFEKRLKFKMFRPIGHEWFVNGYFKIAEPYGNAQDTIDQYLDINNRTWDKYKNLNGDYKLEDGIYHIYDPENNMHHKAVTFEQFKQMKFDIICSTFPTHDVWEGLLKYHPQAKWMGQIGNAGQTSKAPFVISSVFNYTGAPGQKVIFYHQEFDLKQYKFTYPTSRKKISSFVVLLPERELFLKYKEALPEFDFKAYGPGAIDGTVGDGSGISREMKDSAFGWHIKPGGDGYGHIVHKFFASGRPVIIRGNYYLGQTAGLLLEDGKTCIDLDKHSFEENVELIRKFSKPHRHNLMCRAVKMRFDEEVNFDKEAQQIKDYLVSL